MAVQIQLKRGTSAPSAGSFAVGEPAWDATNGRLYVKNTAGTMVAINPASNAVTARSPPSPRRPRTRRVGEGESLGRLCGALVALGAAGCARARVVRREAGGADVARTCGR